MSVSRRESQRTKEATRIEYSEYPSIMATSGFYTNWNDWRGFEEEWSGVDLSGLGTFV